MEFNKPLAFSMFHLTSFGFHFNYGPLDWKPFFANYLVGLRDLRLILDGEKVLILCRVALFFFTLTRKHSSNFFGLLLTNQLAEVATSVKLLTRFRRVFFLTSWYAGLLTNFKSFCNYLKKRLDESRMAGRFKKRFFFPSVFLNTEYQEIANFEADKLAISSFSLFDNLNKQAPAAVHYPFVSSRFSRLRKFLVKYFLKHFFLLPRLRPRSSRVLFLKKRLGKLGYRKRALLFFKFFRRRFNNRFFARAYYKRTGFFLPHKLKSLRTSFSSVHSYIASLQNWRRGIALSGYFSAANFFKFFKHKVVRWKLRKNIYFLRKRKLSRRKLLRSFLPNVTRKRFSLTEKKKRRAFVKSNKQRKPRAFLNIFKNGNLAVPLLKKQRKSKVKKYSRNFKKKRSIKKTKKLLGLFFDPLRKRARVYSRKVFSDSTKRVLDKYALRALRKFRTRRKLLVKRIKRARYFKSR